MRTLTVTRSIDLATPAHTAIAVVQHFDNLASCEPKVDAIELQSASAERGIFHARGRVFGLHWHGAFRYELHASGFDGVELADGGPGLQVRGGFSVQALGPSHCRLSHYEQYRLPLWALPLRPALAWYLACSMRQELTNVAALIVEQRTAA